MSTRSKAVKLSEKFHDFVARVVKFSNITWPKSLVKLGSCPRVDYISDKWDGTWRRYWHEFEDPGTTLYFGMPKPLRGRSILVIIGKFKLTEDGIEGG